MNFRYRLMQFMQGRYGLDRTFYVLFIIGSAFAVVNTIFRLWYLQIIVYLIMGFAIFRILSRNIDARIRENDIVFSWTEKLIKKYNTKKQQSADKTHIYKKCPKCSAVLRLPRRKGKHKTVCPKCFYEFSVRVYRE